MSLEKNQEDDVYSPEINLEKENLRNPLTMKAETIAEVKEHVGESFISEEIIISQNKMDSFLEATGDVNPVHFDKQKIGKSILAESAHGESVAPGFFTLSLCANEKVLYEALIINEPHEVVSFGLKEVKFLSAVPTNSRVVYEYSMKSAREHAVESRPAIIVNWDIKAFIVSEKEKIPCLEASWTLAYVSLPEDK